LLKPGNKNVDLTKDTWQKMVELIEGSQADLTLRLTCTITAQ